MISPFSSKNLRWWTALLLILVIFGGFFSVGYPQSAYAQENTYYDGPSFEDLFEKYAVQCAEAAVMEIVISAVLALIPTSVPVTDWGEKIIKLIKDCLINATKFALLELITGQSVGWSQKGYGGNPSFVQNITQYLMGIADEAAGIYIQNIGGGFLCTPFRAQIQLALTQYYQGQSGRSYMYGQSSCTLSQMTENADAFLAGDFYSGGWGAWFEMVNNPYNTPFGAYLETTAELDRVVAEKAKESSTKLDFASGFLSKETQNCYTTDWVEEDGTVHKDYFKECDPPQVVTPGDTIKTSLEKAFGVKLDTVVAADEINEIISLVAVYLLTDILTKDEGLAGYNYTEDAGFDDPLVVIDDEGGGGSGGGEECTPMEITEGEPGNAGPIPSTDFIATDAEPKMEIRIPDEAGQNYSRVRAEFDLTVGPVGPGDQYNVFWLHRGPGLNNFTWASNDVAEVVHARPRGGGAFNVRFATSVNKCTQFSDNTRSKLDEGEQHHVVVDYNPGEDEMTVTFSGPDGQWSVDNPMGAPTDPVLQSHDQRGRGGFFIVVGSEYNPVGNEGMTGNGWKWENIRVEFTPGPATPPIGIE